ncbi:MAG: PCRF domain-containing protein, partial [Rhodospirillaceae bacterium]|nr:PCRF domain-containing protein [Rhodospirillaceae bacterium]
MFDYDNAVLRLEELNAQSENPDLWNDPDKAQALMRERTSLEDGLKLLDGLTQETEDSIELIAMGEAEDDTDVVAEAEEVLSVVRETAAKAELQTLLSGEVDANDCYLEVHAGAGGTEAQDWAEMLLR